MPTLLEIALSNALVAIALAVLAAGVSYWWRRPALTHGLWLLVLLKLVTPPLVPISVPWPHAAEAQAAAPAAQVQTVMPELPSASAPASDVMPTEGAETWIIVVPETPAAPAPAPEPARWPYTIATVWLVGSVLWFVWTGVSILRFRQLMRYARPAPVHLQQTVGRLAECMGLRHVPGVSVVSGAVSPMVWFVGRAPRLLFPARLLETLDEDQRQTLLAHELAHVRRGDHRVRLLELLVTGLYWWHPVVWWARREIHEAEEQCCDAWVVSTLAGAERTYALALLQAVAFVSKARAALPAAASGIGQVPHLRRRLTMICQTKTPRSLSWAGWAAVGGVGLLLLPLLPIRAQEPVEPASRQSQVEQQRIEKAVRKAMEFLDQEQHAKPTKSKAKTKKDSKAIQQARAEVEKARANFKAAQAQLAEAEARLAKLGGKPITFTGKFIQSVQVEGKPQGKVWIWEGPNKSSNGTARLEIDTQPGAAKVYGYRVITPNSAAKPGETHNYRYRVITTVPGKKAGSVEEKLDQLQREIEELRKELKHEKPTSGQKKQQFRFRVVPAAPAAGAVPLTPATPSVAAAPAAIPAPVPSVSAAPPSLPTPVLAAPPSPASPPQPPSAAPAVPPPPAPSR